MKVYSETPILHSSFLSFMLFYTLSVRSWPNARYNVKH